MSDFHGRFIWYELMTSDVEAAKAFYGKVVGWTAQDVPMGDMTYTRLLAGGVGVAGAMPMMGDAQAQGVPPNWTSYVAVDDCDAAAAKVKALGGSVFRAPDDIPGIGRFAIVADPTGAVIALMTPAPMDEPQPRLPAGAEGTTGWHELYAGDLETAFGFYAELFGWTKDSDMDMGAMGAYRLFSNRDGQVGGMMRKPDDVPAPAWIYYFRTGPIDAAAGRVRAAGGQVLSEPMEVPGGDWVLQAADPQGAMFALVGPKG